MQKVNVKVRKAYPEEIDTVFECHKQCFEQGDQWYKSVIGQNIKSTYVVVVEANNEIIGVMIQGDIKPCEQSEADDFEPLDKTGEMFKNNNFHLDNLFGITMLCILPKYRNKGIASKLIDFHLKMNQDEMLCLNTRKSNPAINLYLKKGYKHIANIKNKYFSPNEDSYFLIKD